MTSSESTILTAVKSTIDGLSLTAEETAIRKWPHDSDGHWYPGITISRGKENEFAGTNQVDHIGYRVQVTMVVDNSGDPTEDDLFATWRVAIRKAFIHQRLSGVTSVCTCLVEPGPVYENVPENYDVSALVIRVINQESRT